MAADDRKSPLDLALGPPESARRKALERFFGAKTDPPAEKGGAPAPPRAPAAAPDSTSPPAAPPVDERSALDRARSDTLRDHRSVLPALVEARRKLHGEAVAILEYLKELQGRMLAHDGLAREWEARAAAALGRDPRDERGLARYAVKKRLHHVREAKTASERVGEMSAALERLLDATVDLDRRLEQAAHLERRITLAKGVADAKAELVNALHAAEAGGGVSGAGSRLAETARLAEAESEMGDALLGMEFADGGDSVDAAFRDAEIEEELRRLGGTDGGRLLK